MFTGIIFVFVGLLGLKVLNGFILSTWIHRITKTDHKIYNFLLGYGIQMAFFGVLLFVSFLFNLNFADIQYIFLFGEIFIAIIGIINVRYLYSYKKIQLKYVVLVFVLVGLTLFTNLIYFYFFLLDQKVNLNYLLTFSDKNLIQNLHHTLTHSVDNNFFWGNEIIFFTFKSYFLPEMITNSTIFSYLEFGLIFSLIFLNLYKARILHFQKHNLLVFAVITIVSWIILFWIVLVNVHIYWFLIYTFVLFLVIINLNRYNANVFFWIFNIFSLSNMFYNQESFYWILCTSVFAIIYFWKTAHPKFIYLSLSVLFGMMWSIVYLFYFSIQNVASLWIIQALSISALILSLLILSLLYAYNQNWFVKMFYQMHNYAMKYTGRIFLLISVGSMFAYGIYLGFNNYEEIGLLFKQWSRFDNGLNSLKALMSIILAAIYLLTIIYFLIKYFLFRNKFRAFNSATAMTLTIVANPISYLIYLFMFYTITKTHQTISNDLFANIFPFTVFVFINITASTLLTKDYYLNFNHSLERNYVNHQ